MENKPYVFISYAHLDSAAVLPCIEAMKSNGINLWYDDGIEAGSEWPEFIAEKVMDCTKFVLFVSKAYLNSQNCKRELNFAISRKKDILSIFLEDVVLSPGMEMQLGTYQALYRKRFESGQAFHSSLCSESFFNSCRKEAPNLNTPPKNQPNATSAPHTTNTNNGFDGSAPAASPYQKNTAMSLPIKNRMVAALLAIFLGGFGIHKFYLKKTGLGILYLFLFWSYIPSIVSLIEGIILLCSSDQRFEQKYNCRTK